MTRITYVARSGASIDQFNTGEFRRALEFAERFAEVVADAGNTVDRMMADRLLATTLHYRGDQTADEALARREARDEGWYVAELWRIKGELLLPPCAGTFRSSPEASARQASPVRSRGRASETLR